MISGPPGWSSRNGVTSYTLPSTAIQQSVLLACDPISASVTTRALPAGGAAGAGAPPGLPVLPSVMAGAVGRRPVASNAGGGAALLKWIVIWGRIREIGFPQTLTRPSPFDLTTHAPPSRIMPISHPRWETRSKQQLPAATPPANDAQQAGPLTPRQHPPPR